MTKTAGQGQGQERNDIPAPPTQKWLTVKDSVVGKVLEENYLFDFLTLLFQSNSEMKIKQWPNNP